MDNIVLTGLPGSGKTTLGKELAQRLHRQFIDLDEWITASTGLAVERIFSAYGEGFFRQVEAKAVQKAIERRGAVIATGGGVILRDDNMETLRSNGTVIFLDRPVEHIAEDIDIGHRPLLKANLGHLYELNRQRRERYRSTSHLTVANNRDKLETLNALATVAMTVGLNGFAVIGDPIGHSLSPQIHQAVFDLLGIKESYTAIHVPRGRIAEFLTAVRYSGLRGFNATIPHKTALIPLMEEIQEEAARCGAVNTVVVRDGKFTGYNTDMEGLAASLSDSGHGLYGRRILILGTGGVAGSTALKAAREQAASITVLGRRPEKAAEIAANIKGESNCPAIWGDMSQESMAKAAEQADILINATPLGMTGIEEDFLDFSFLEALPKNALICDLIYSPPKTTLLRRAEALGLSTLNGLGMLIYQALLAEEHFLGRKLDKKQLYQHIANKGFAINR